MKKNCETNWMNYTKNHRNKKLKKFPYSGTYCNDLKYFNLNETQILVKIFSDKLFKDAKYCEECKSTNNAYHLLINYKKYQNERNELLNKLKNLKLNMNINNNEIRYALLCTGGTELPQNLRLNIIL